MYNKKFPNGASIHYNLKEYVTEFVKFGICKHVKILIFGFDCAAVEIQYQSNLHVHVTVWMFASCMQIRSLIVLLSLFLGLCLCLPPPSIPPYSLSPPPYLFHSLSLSLTFSALFNQSKQLSAQLQCVYVLTRPTDLPGRLVPQDVVNTLLPSLLDNVVITSAFLFDGPVREVDGLK